MMECMSHLVTLMDGYLQTTIDWGHRRSVVLQQFSKSERSWAPRASARRNWCGDEQEDVDPWGVITPIQVANGFSSCLWQFQSFLEPVAKVLNDSHKLVEGYGLQFFEAKTADIV